MPDSELHEVITLAEAAQIFYRGKGTIRYHINRGNLRWRKTSGKNGVYLISLQSLIQLYGQPPEIARS